MNPVSGPVIKVTVMKETKMAVSCLGESVSGWLRVWEIRLYCTGCVGGHWSREPIALGLAEEIVDGGAQKRAALLLLTHQLWRQIDETV